MNGIARIALAFFDVFALSPVPCALSPVPSPPSPPSWLGKLAFVGVFVILLVWLLVIPDRLIGNVDGRPPWWRNARVWAILVCLTQVVVYLYWG